MAKKTRMTNQKIKIMEYLRSVKSHPNAETVFKEVRKDLPAISLATVYRNLNALADAGSILRFEVNKEFRYDADTTRHQHCVCRECGKIFDVFQSEISEYALNKFNHRGFTPDFVYITYYGKCKDCGG